MSGIGGRLSGRDHKHLIQEPKPARVRRPFSNPLNLTGWKEAMAASEVRRNARRSLARQHLAWKTEANAKARQIRNLAS